jgi:hypothetical protein
MATPPTPAIPRTRPTPRPQGPKPTSGTVAFPLAPLQCRSSIYTTFGAENPHSRRLALETTPISTEPLAREQARSPVVARFPSTLPTENLVGKSSTTQVRWLTRRPPVLSFRNLRLICEKYGALFREVNHARPLASFCKLWKTYSPATGCGRWLRFLGRRGRGRFRTDNSPNLVFYPDHHNSQWVMTRFTGVAERFDESHDGRFRRGTNAGVTP